MSSKTVKPKDVNAPKRPPSSYLIFAKERRPILKAIRDCSASQISKLLSEQWKELSPKQKSIYEEYYNLQKAKYEIEVFEYQQTPKYEIYQQKLFEWQCQQNIKKNKNANTNTLTNRIKKCSLNQKPKLKQSKKHQKQETRELQFGRIGGSLKLLEYDSKVICHRPLFGKEENAFSLNGYHSGIINCSFQISSISTTYKCSKMTIGVIPAESIPKNCREEISGYRLGFSEKNVPNSIGYWYSGHVYYEGNKLKDYGSVFKLNDVISVQMDFHKMKLYLFHNGVKQSSKKYNLKLMKNTSYYFAVSLAYPGQELTIVC